MNISNNNVSSDPYAGLKSSYNSGSSKTKNGLNKSKSENSEVESIQKQIEVKKEELTKLASNEKMSDDAKKVKREQIENDIKSLEQQLNSAKMAQQQKQIEENKENVESSSPKQEKTQQEEFTETMSFVSGQMNSIQSHKQLKAVLKRDLTRLSSEIETDAKNGYSSSSKEKELTRLENGISNLDTKINNKMGSINNSIEEFSEKPEKDKKTEDKKEEDKKEENKEDEKVSNENLKDTENNSVINLKIKKVSEKYGANSSESYKSKEENNLNIAL